jgi:hypothetical protein
MEAHDPSAERGARTAPIGHRAHGDRAAAGAIVVAALAFGLWRVRDIIVLLLLALTFAAPHAPASG